jgi:hypothetical protein
MCKQLLLGLLGIALAAFPTHSIGQNIKRGAAVFIESDGSPFHDEVAAAIRKKGVPLVQVQDRAEAEYVLSGVLDAENHIGRGISMFPQASAHAMLILSGKDGKQIFSCSSTKGRAYNGYRSVAEDCSKRLAKAINSPEMR